MREYDIYLPAQDGEGHSIDCSVIDQIKQSLVDTFGGYTHLNQRNEGVWRMGGVTFRDEVSIVRVLDDGSAEFDFAAFKQRLERELRQESVLIVSREVSTV